ncbi:unnamed protein product [Anisakis simplex]|nr:unnamed protein product [Anisakis simplex]
MILAVSMVNVIVQLITLVISQITATAQYAFRECATVACEDDIIVPAWISPFPYNSSELLITKSRERIAKHRDFQQESLSDSEDNANQKEQEKET